MTKRIAIWIAATAWLAVAAPAAIAENLAVIIANYAYRTHPNVPQGQRVLNLEQTFQRAGFRTIVIANMTTPQMLDRMPDIGRQIVRADRVAVVLSGYFGQIEGRSYLMMVDAQDPDVFQLGRQSLAMDAIYNLMRSKPGEAVVAVASPEDGPSFGWRVAYGHRIGDIPNGLTLVTGTPATVTAFMPELLVRGRPIFEARQYLPNGARLLGYLPRGLAFLPAATDRPVPVESDFVLWQQAADANTIAAYRLYLRNYPNGRFAQQARDRIANLQLSPVDRARLDEEALQLNRDRRQRLQRYLTILGFDTKGIDGVFGPNTRTAVRAYQASLGAPQTGYLTAQQVTRIEQDGARRAEELRREAEQRQAEREQRDRAYWQQTGATGSEDGLLAYLANFPDGLYAEQAKAELKSIERQNRRQAAREERLAWDRAVMTGTLDSYQTYLNAYPDGRFAAEARARIDSLDGPEIPPDLLQQAEAAEIALQLDPFRRRLVELQLQRLGFDTGPADGEFTRDTRAAIRAYQRRNRLPVTGYVSSDLLVMLLVAALE